MKPDLERIKEIFSQAMQKKSPAERERFLADTCQGDAELRQQVESLLRAEGQAGEFLAQTVQLPPANFVAEKPGDKIGRYKLLQQIGAGGCGVVYMADQEEPVKRRVALKVIKPGMDTREVLGRFEAERQVLALMDHPNIAKVLDAGATETGRPFFVMELVRGIPITRYCDENKLNTEQRLELFIKVCQAIQHAHQKGIIHRDIKPSNILVADHDGVPVPKVIDFGIAKATSGQTLTDKTVFTALEQFIGTPAYMSPEQAKMSGLDIDTRSDIYSLGVLLYELLTGKTPFDAKKLFEAGFDEIRRIIREEEPPRPSQKLSTLTAEEQTTTARSRQTDSPRLLHLVSGDLDWIVMKCLEKDRNRRYETANGLASDLERHINNEPVLARPPSNVYRFQKLVRRNKLVFAAGTAVGAAVLIGLAVSTYLFIQERRAEHEQSQLRKEAEAARQYEAALRAKAQAAEKTAVDESKKAKSETQRAEAAATEVKMTLASSDFLLALPLIEKNDRSDALAYLAKSLSLNPTNEAAATRLTTLLASHSWWVPLMVFNASSAQFSPDGKRIVTASKSAARVWDAQTGRLLTEFSENMTPVEFAQFSPDGKRIVTVASFVAQVWDAQTGQPLTEPLGEVGVPVESAQFSPDGKRIVTATQWGTAQVWDAQSGQPLTQPWKQNDGATLFMMHSAQFSPDGKRIVTASDDGTARVWDAQTGQPITDPLKLNLMNSAQFSPDGTRIVTTSQWGGLRVWDAQSGQLLQRNDSATSAQFSLDGKRIVAASIYEIAQVLDAQSDQLLAETLKHGGWVNSAQFSPDGKRIVTASEDHTARVWDAQNGQPLSEALKHPGEVKTAQFSPDGKRILTASDDGNVRVWGAVGSQPLTEILYHNSIVFSAQFSPDGKRIVTASDDGTVRVWDAQTGQPLIEPVQFSPPINASWVLGSDISAQFSPDGKRILTASDNGTARVWDAQSSQPLTEPLQHSTAVNSAQFSPDGKQIVTASDDGTARVWDAQNGQPLANITATNSARFPRQSNHLSAQFSPDGKRIVTASDDGTARVWNAQNGQPLTEPLKHKDKVVHARFSPDGKRIVTASWDKTARVWDAETGQPLMEALKHNGLVESAEFSPDGKQIVTAADDGTARVWDAQTGRPLTDPFKHGASVKSAQFSPDGGRIVTASEDGTARVWDVQTGQPLTGPLQHGREVYSARFSPDGKRIVTASWDRTAVVWDIAPSGASHPDWLPQLAEVICGECLNKQGVLEQTTLNRGDILNQLRQRLNQESDDDGWVHWGRWFLADPATRTISPFSKITVPAPTTMPTTPEITEIIPSSRETPIQWSYTTEKPGKDWAQPNFDATSWKKGPAGFGTSAPGAVVRTLWNTGDIWVRREFVMPSNAVANLKFQVYHDEDVEIYVNGILAAAAGGFTTSYVLLDIQPAARSLLKQGAQITLAAHCHQTVGGQNIDIGLADVRKLPSPVAKP